MDRLPYGSDWLLALLMLGLFFTGVGWWRVHRNSRVPEAVQLAGLVTSATAWVAALVLLLMLL